MDLMNVVNETGGYVSTQWMLATSGAIILILLGIVAFLYKTESKKNIEATKDNTSAITRLNVTLVKNQANVDNLTGNCIKIHDRLDKKIEYMEEVQGNHDIRLAKIETIQNLK